MDWKVMPMTTKRLPNTDFFMLLVLLVIEFPEPLEEDMNNSPRENNKPSLDFALNGNNGSDEDE